MEPTSETVARPGRVRVRSASSQDVKDAALLIRRYWKAATDRKLRVLAVEELRWLARASRLGGGLNVIRVDGVVRGVVGWRRNLSDPSRGLILTLCVEPGDWEAGAFEALLESALRGLSRAGCEDVDVWLAAEASPARFAAEALGFLPSDERRQLGVLGASPSEEAPPFNEAPPSKEAPPSREAGVAEPPAGGEVLDALRYTRPLEPLPFAPELIRLTWPRFLLGLLVVAPFVLLMLPESRNLLPLTGLALPLGALAPSLAEVWSRRSRRRGTLYGLSCTLASLVLGVGWTIHVAALDGGGPSSLLRSGDLFNPAIWILGAHWAPLWLLGGLLGARSLRGNQRTEAFLAGTALLVLSMFLGVLPLAPINEGLGVLFGVFCCSVPTAWFMGTISTLLFWFADDLRDSWGESLELHFAPAEEPA